MKYPKRVHRSLIARIKILSNLRLDESRKPQDGRFSTVINKNKVDFRVATFPTANGEKVTLRVLNTQKGIKTLEELGLDEQDTLKLLKALKKPYGMILATGPTGAGKTTTLYALLNTVDTVTKNVVSLEDPVEYRLDGINQSNIKPEIGYSFGNGLRSVLRGDPDEILIGEIRDKETAHLAVQAALTGHTVYSTLHTNTAIGAVARLINFGIPPFILASSLSLVIGQRMTRRLSNEGKDYPISLETNKRLEKIFSDLPASYKSKLPEFKSFKKIAPTTEDPEGLKGRIGVFETFEVDDEIEELILKESSEQQLFASARKKGYLTMEEDAIKKGLNGIIPYSEIVKISSQAVLDIKLNDENENTEEKDLNSDIQETTKPNNTLTPNNSAPVINTTTVTENQTKIPTVKKI